MDTSIELIFITSTLTGHLVSAVEMAKLLIARDSRLSITLLLINNPFAGNTTTAESLSASVASERINFVELPSPEPTAEMTPMSFLTISIESQKPHVRDAVKKISSCGSVCVAGFVLDMFCTAMIDVADEINVPSYVFFTSGAGLLCLMAHLTTNDIEDDDELAVRGFAFPIPKRLFPFDPTNKASSSLFLGMSRGIGKSKGVLVNTFEELEPGAIEALSSLDREDKFPPVYPVGPLINLAPKKDSRGSEMIIMEWLDSQPASSVVFLCFGSTGSFDEDQAREIAAALERARVRFLWSVSRPVALPEGFLERTAGIGRVVGWAPQAAVLGHVAVGGFVSHCGWNSTLESLWFGVPMGTWPLGAEQHLNAFSLLSEFGLAVDIAIENRRESLVVAEISTVDSGVVKAEKIEMGIEKLMGIESGVVRKKAKEMSQNSRKALLHGASSHASLSRFISNVMDSLA